MPDIPREAARKAVRRYWDSHNIFIDKDKLADIAVDAYLAACGELELGEKR